MTLFTRLTIVFCLPLLALANPAFADPTTLKTPGTPNTTAKPERVTSASIWGADRAKLSNGNIVILKQSVSLANLPDFSGHKKFQKGSVRTTDMGEGWVQYFMVKEPAKEVMDWYDQVLNAQQWKITNRSPVMITATYKSGDLVSVSTQPLRAEKDARCQLIISYFLPNKKNK